MALIQCPECNHQVSDKATSCPQCGCPIMVSESQGTIVEQASKQPTKVVVKNIPKKAVVIIVAVVVLFVAIWALAGGSSSVIDADIKLLQDCLLDPDSLIIYQAYTNENYGDHGRATLFYFGAKNKSGGISDDWAFVYNGSILFESNFTAAKNAGDNKGILENGQLVFAQFAVSMGHESWQKVEIE